MDQDRRDGGFVRNAVEFALERLDEASNQDGDDRDSALGNARTALREVRDILG